MSQITKRRLSRKAKPSSESRDPQSGLRLKLSSLNIEISEQALVWALVLVFSLAAGIPITLNLSEEGGVANILKDLRE